MTPRDPHHPDTGHEPVDVDPLIPTGLCAVCADEKEPPA